MDVKRVKNSLSGEHPIEGDEIRVLRAWLRIRPERTGHDFVLANHHCEPFSRQAITYLFGAIAQRAGLPHVNPHMLRHTCGYILADQNEPFWHIRSSSARAARHWVLDIIGSVADFITVNYDAWASHFLLVRLRASAVSEGFAAHPILRCFNTCQWPRFRRAPAATNLIGLGRYDAGAIGGSKPVATASISVSKTR
jgi:integrase-like protein